MGKASTCTGSGGRDLLFREVTRALARRWYLLLLGVLLAVGAAYVGWDQTSPRYTTESTSLLLPPLSATEGTAPKGRDGNPLLYLGGLGQARDVLLNVMSSESLKQGFEARFPDTEYTVTPDSLSSGPIVVMTVDAPTAELAATSGQYLTDSLAQRLTAMQSELSVDKDAVIRSMTLTAPTDPKSDNKLQVRVAALAGVGILVLSLLLIALLDGLLRSRGRRMTKSGVDARISPPPSDAGGATIDTRREWSVQNNPERVEPGDGPPAGLQSRRPSVAIATTRGRVAARSVAATAGRAARLGRRARRRQPMSQPEKSSGRSQAALGHQPAASSRPSTKVKISRRGRRRRGTTPSIHTRS